ncbi:hypothetical protein PEPS_35850 (plasmid) [Persicobacter psychrovividus]|uniref:Uncharacterized protein n=1 Tax=Persicobacter psychrovividus TaxID=387638 RepID=A0ABN6LDN8_9BACT|nr:hypothetical protein PEPS_35850 [Persicobacter psychrovividus]
MITIIRQKFPLGIDQGIKGSGIDFVCSFFIEMFTHCRHSMSEGKGILPLRFNHQLFIFIHIAKQLAHTVRHQDIIGQFKICKVFGFRTVN